MSKFLYTIAIGAVMTGFIAPAQAADGKDPLSKDRFMVRLRAIDVVPDESSNVNIGGKVEAKNAITPEVDLSYFITDNIAVEAIAATSRGSELGKAWVLPPTVTLQYHFTPDQTFSPYVGAGINYSLFYNEKTASGFTDLKVDGGFGYALQAGTDIWINKNWGLNLDVKKVFLNVDAKLNGGAVSADVDLDPWIVGAGVSYHF